MERKIGEIFEYNGDWYQCVESPDCTLCAFNETDCNDIGIEDCCANRRKDNKDVIFKKLEKVGEPYAEGNSIVSERMFQKYRTYEKNFFLNERDLLFTSYGDIVSIEIKQTKEDMEENKPKEDMEENKPKEDNPLTRVVYNYVNGKISDKELIRSIKEMSDEYPYNKNNLKPFSLELAKQGKPVCTRDGRKARIICFDRQHESNIVALITEANEEYVCTYNSDGSFYKGTTHKNDLMMLPERKKGWINVYNSLGVITFSHNPYDTKEEALEALKSASGKTYYVDTIKISWEE